MERTPIYSRFASKTRRCGLGLGIGFDNEVLGLGLDANFVCSNLVFPATIHVELVIVYGHGPNFVEKSPILP